MTRYLVLLAPSGNRVYSGEAPALCRAELAVLAGGCLPGVITDIGTATLASVQYVSFSGDLQQRDLDLIANLSGAFAIFRIEGADDDELLRPIAARPLDVFDDDLLSIPKYSGKTNEQFTRLLLNVTIASTAFADELGERRFSIFDPLAGRGTTLDMALTYGFDAAGVEIELREVEAYATFLSTYLKRKRLKHTFEFVPMRRDGKKIGKRLDATVNPDAEAFKRGDRQSVRLICGDTMASNELFGSRRFDAIVTDAPYGVAHGSRAGGGPSRDRSATDLLTQAVPIWTKLLKPGGALGIGWNTLGLSREDLGAILRRAGLDVLDDDAYRSFEHRVDSAIIRDVLVGRRRST